MAGSWKIMLRAMWDKEPNEDGYPIYIRFRQRGCRPIFSSTGKYVKNKDCWNQDLTMVTKGTNIRLTNEITHKKLKEAKTRIEEAEAAGEALTKAVLEGKKLVNFEDFAREVCGDNNCTRSFIKKGRRYNGGKIVDGKITNGKVVGGKVVGGEIDIHHITITWLRRLQNWLVDVDDYAHGSMVVCMKFYQQVCNQAVREGYTKYSPFGEGKYEVPAQKQGNPTFLVADERNALLKGLLNKVVKNPRTHRVLAYFLLGVYSGIRFSDWALFDINKMVIKEPTGDFILLRARKNNGNVQMTIGHSLQKVLDVIAEVGPLDMEYKTVMEHLDKIQMLFSIKKELTTHVARHSFGFLCAALGISKTITALWMAIHENTVEIYYHITGDSVKEQSKQMADV